MDDAEYWTLERGPNTSEVALDIWRQNKDHQNPPKPDTSILDLMGHAQESKSSGEVGSEQAGSFARSSVGPTKDWGWRDAPRKPRRPETGLTSVDPAFLKACKVCGSPLPLDAPNNMTMHKKCRQRQSKRRYRAKLAAERKELRQLLGEEPIDG